MARAKLSDEEIQATHNAVKSSGSITEAAEKLGIPRSTLQNRLHNYPNLGTGKKALPARKITVAKPSKKSLADFQATYDKDVIVPTKIEAAIAALGEEGWEYETAFAKLAGVGLTDLSNYRDQFSDYIVLIRRDSKRAWAGSVETAQAMREMLA